MPAGPALQGRPKVRCAWSCARQNWRRERKPVRPAAALRLRFAEEPEEQLREPRRVLELHPVEAAAEDMYLRAVDPLEQGQRIPRCGSSSPRSSAGAAPGASRRRITPRRTPATAWQLGQRPEQKVASMYSSVYNAFSIAVYVILYHDRRRSTRYEFARPLTFVD